MPVTFGTPDNYRTEHMQFEVADLQSTYNAVLGRPALAKFMAIPHYIYLVLKMPGPAGVITLRGDVKKAYECDRENCDMADVMAASLELAKEL